jgi:hypothetical protein
VKRLTRFSLRTFLFSVVCLAVCSAWIGNERFAYRTEQRALQQIQTAVQFNKGVYKSVRAEHHANAGLVLM